jgi:putative addiction module component (TIGR02574 family)
MTTEVSDILKKALALPHEARAAIAGSLLESLNDAPADEGVEAAWSEEIKRRIEEIDSGKVQMIPYEEVRAAPCSQDVPRIVACEMRKSCSSSAPVRAAQPSSRCGLAHAERRTSFRSNCFVRGTEKVYREVWTGVRPSIVVS